MYSKNVVLYALKYEYIQFVHIKNLQIVAENIPVDKCPLYSYGGFIFLKG